MRRRPPPRAAAYLDGIAGQEELLWGQVETLVGFKRAKEYDQALQILLDLRDLSARAAQPEMFAARLPALRARHATKTSLIGRLDRAGLP